MAARVTNRLGQTGVERSFLGTDDFRLTAINVYLKLGWRPFLYQEDMEGRWRHIYGKLGRPFERTECAIP